MNECMYTNLNNQFNFRHVGCSIGLLDICCFRHICLFLFLLLGFFSIKKNWQLEKVDLRLLSSRFFEAYDDVVYYRNRILGL